MAYSPNYLPESPYALTPLVGRYMTYYGHRQIAPHPMDRLAVIDYERYVHRPDLLALDIYQTEDLFWVIPVRNGLQDLIFDLEMGTEIIIPDPAYVRSIR